MKTTINLSDHRFIKVKESLNQIMHDIRCDEKWITVSGANEGNKWTIQVSHIVSIRETEDE